MHSLRSGGCALVRGLHAQTGDYRGAGATRRLNTPDAGTCHSAASRQRSVCDTYVVHSCRKQLVPNVLVTCVSKYKLIAMFSLARYTNVRVCIELEAAV